MSVLIYASIPIFLLTILLEVGWARRHASRDIIGYARKDTLAKQFQALQDKYTKEGKLDEAVAIRDYIKAGMPGLDGMAKRIKR